MDIYINNFTSFISENLLASFSALIDSGWWSGVQWLPVGLKGLVSRLEGRKEAQHYQILRLESPLALTLSTLSAVAMNGNGKIDGDGVIFGEQEAQLMLTTGSTRLLAVSRARAISDGTLT